MPWFCSGQTRDVLVDEIALAKRSNSKAASPEISRHPRKACRFQPRGHRRRVYRHERAPNVSNPVQPPILNLKREENTAKPKHATNFRKYMILQFVRTQMMKHQNGDSRRKRVVRKRQCRGIPLDRSRIRAADAPTQLGCESVIVFETGHLSRAAPQFVRRRAKSRT